MTETTEAAATQQAPAAPAIAQSKPCFCRAFRLTGQTEDEVFATGCERETKSVFAQGHDAQLVSFLVEGHADGYQISQVLPDGSTVKHSDPGSAASQASEALGNKARKATETRALREQEKAQKAADRETAKQAKAAERQAEKDRKAAEKEAAKQARAAEQKTKSAEVVAGSREGDPVELGEGQARIKVGRFEYVADIDPDSGDATYTTGAGERKVVERDGYRLLEPTA